jgi:hypothetical protein
MSHEKSPAECCPQFDPTPWNEKTFIWKNKKFIKDKVFTLFYMPVNFGTVIIRMMKKIKGAGAEVPDFICLSDHTSKWNMDLYVAVDKEVPASENVTLNGKFFSKVYQGPYKDCGKWHQDFENYVANQGLKIKKMFAWYTTCPKCAKKYGKNYVVIFGELV